MGGTPGLPPDPGNQVTGRPGAEKGEGMGEGEGATQVSVSGGAKHPTLLFPPRTHSVQGKSATPFWISRLVRFP